MHVTRDYRLRYAWFVNYLFYAREMSFSWGFLKSNIKFTAEISDIEITFLDTCAYKSKEFEGIPFSSPETALLLVSTKNRDRWPGPTPEVRDSRTSRHSAHAQSQVGQIWFVLVSIYCVYKAIQNRNVVGLGRPEVAILGAGRKERGLWGPEWKESILELRTHFKPTETFQYTHFTSCHPPGVRKGFIKGEALRLLRTNFSKATFEEKHYTIQTQITDNLRKTLFQKLNLAKQCRLYKINKKRAKELCRLLQNIAHLCVILKTFLWVNGILNRNSASTKRDL